MCVCAWNNAVSPPITSFFYWFWVIIGYLWDATGQNRCVCVQCEFCRVPVSAPLISPEVLNVSAPRCEKHHNTCSTTLGLRWPAHILLVGYFVKNVHCSSQIEYF